MSTTCQEQGHTARAGSTCTTCGATNVEACQTRQYVWAHEHAQTSKAYADALDVTMRSAQVLGEVLADAPQGDVIMARVADTAAGRGLRSVALSIARMYDLTPRETAAFVSEHAPRTHSGDNDLSGEIVAAYRDGAA